jgi:hypothetical protein
LRKRHIHGGPRRIDHVPDHGDDQVLTVPEWAAICGVSLHTAYRNLDPKKTPAGHRPAFEKSHRHIEARSPRVAGGARAFRCRLSKSYCRRVMNAQIATIALGVQP